MPTVEPFEAHTERYEAWFEANEHAYRSELAAVERLLPDARPALAVGVGSGRFAGPLDVGHGVDPSPAMLDQARERGVETVQGVAEALPYSDDAFAAALNVTTVCFLDDLGVALREARRVLEPGGHFVTGFVDRESPLGQRYEELREENPFYRDATFRSTDELADALAEAGFEGFAFAQTVFRFPGEMDEPDPVRDGTGEGSFVVVRARTPEA
jgi:SAM-dependent methyltransferase